MFLKSSWKKVSPRGSDGGFGGGQTCWRRPSKAFTFHVCFVSIHFIHCWSTPSLHPTAQQHSALCSEFSRCSSTLLFLTFSHPDFHNIHSSFNGINFYLASTSYSYFPTPFLVYLSSLETRRGAEKKGGSTDLSRHLRIPKL